MTWLVAPLPTDVAAFRAEQSARPLRPYEHVSPQERGGKRAVKTAEAVLARGWRLSGGPPLRLDRPVLWHGIEARRSWWFHLNCLDPIAPLLDALDVTGDERYLAPAADLAASWAHAHQSFEGENSFAWYDMAVGLRAYRLAYLLDVMARSESCSDAQVALVLSSVLLHAHSLADDDAFAWHSNHGLYQAVGQLAMARRLPTLEPMPAARVQGLVRLEELIDAQFTDEGVHVEHSPSYHWIVLRTLRGALAAGLVEDEGLLERLQTVEEALSWFVLPDGHLVMFGDTSWRRIDASRLRRGASRPPDARAIPSGEARPPVVARAFPSSGYFVVRTDGERLAARDGSYLALNAAFHSRTHKHADDLSFVWFDRGREILVDAGCFGFVGSVEQGSALSEDGFWYSHPSRVYVESTRAHNALEIDGRNYQRRDQPYGSALRRWARCGSSHAVEASVLHFDTIDHTRLLVFDPGRWVLVVDSIADRAGLDHDLAQRFHLAPDLDVGQQGRQCHVPMGDGENLSIIPLGGTTGTELVRGRPEPELLGWISRRIGEMTPCWSVAFRVRGGPEQTLATLLTFGSAEPMEVAMPPSGGEVWAWGQDGAVVTVRIDRSPAALALEVTDDR